MVISLTINGQDRRFEIAPGETLLEALRENGYVGVKHGCGDGSCGMCAVLLDGQVVPACVMLAAQTAGRQVTTVEGLGTREHPHPLQAAFVEAGAIQCGYCAPAMILSAAALLSENPHPTETEVREALSGVLCRCTGYVKPVEAVLHAVEMSAGGV